MRTLRTSVRRLVEFLLRSGDIDSTASGSGGIEAMLAGGDIHRTLQAAAGSSYQAEVPLARSLYFPDGSFSPHAARLDIREESVEGEGGFFLHVEGRADGIVDDGRGPVVVDEIKGTARDVSAILEPDPIHEAQALCYAYLYLCGKLGPSVLSTASGERVTVRLTYASMTTGEVRQLERTHGAPDIEAWFFRLLGAAQRWAAWRVSHEALRDQSLAALEFPLAPRDGQRELMGAVASAIREERRLFAQAPTGSGKTLATLFPALKALGSGEVSRVAFLTAKTTTRASALQALLLLRQRGLAANVLAVTARDRICPLRSTAHAGAVRARPLSSLCNPVECPLARGHYDHANDALFEAIRTHDVLDSQSVAEVASGWHVCPYELQRDLARWADVIVCDYHYAFAPSASLLGLAGEPGGGDAVFLVDEAHNLVDRMRDMYSAELRLGDLKGLERLLRTRANLQAATGAVRTAIHAFPSWEKALPTGDAAGRGRRGRRVSHRVVSISDDFASSLAALTDEADATLEQLLPGMGAADRGEALPEGGTVELFLALRDASCKARGLLAGLQRAETGYATFVEPTKDGLVLRLLCVDPSRDLQERLGQAKAAVFFSGTLLPMDYHRRLLAARGDDPSVCVSSGFDSARRQVLVASDVSARYSARGPALYARVAAYLITLVRTRPGNYLVFLPSYATMEELARVLGPMAQGIAEVVRQRPGMREDERERFVSRFRQGHGTRTSLVGLCVLGGVFGEGIDLPGESLIGVAVVGTGMPVASAEREVIREHFDARGGNGFAYAYTYPGLIKVLQAAGRLIRTERDEGVVLLLDDRFLERELREELPREWGHATTCTLSTLPALLARERPF